MIKREKLVRSPDYWFEHAQNDLYAMVVEYMEKEGINQNQLAERLGFSKGYVSQLLKGEFNHSLRKLIELGLAIGMVPRISYQSVESLSDPEKSSVRKFPRKNRDLLKARKKTGTIGARK